MPIESFCQDRMKIADFMAEKCENCSITLYRLHSLSNLSLIYMGNLYDLGYFQLENMSTLCEGVNNIFAFAIHPGWQNVLNGIL